MEAAIRFIKFNPEATYELKGLCGTTLDMLGGHYWRNKRGEINYVGDGYRHNGLVEILKMREEDAPAATLWEILPDGRKNQLLDNRPGKVKIDQMR